MNRCSLPEDPHRRAVERQRYIDVVEKYRGSGEGEERQVKRQEKGKKESQLRNSRVVVGRQ